MKYIIDLDGTIMNGNQPLPGAVSLFNYLTDRKAEYLIMTNSVKSPESIVARLAGVNIRVNEACILNPISAINDYMKREGITRVFIAGSENEAVQINGARVVQNPKDSDLIALLDFEKTNADYTLLQSIADMMMQGIRTVTASYSPYYLKNDRRALDTGAFVRLLENVTDKNIAVFGKPSNVYFLSGLSLLKSDAQNTTVIGDDWQTDIVGANALGCCSILVKSGKYQPGDEIKGKPVFCVKTLEDIVSII